MLRHTSTLLAAFVLLLPSAASRAAGSDVGFLVVREGSANIPPLSRPEVFRRLSQAGRIAALRAAGLFRAGPAAAEGAKRATKAPLGNGARSDAASGLRFSSAAAAGQNVRVNDPSLDTSGHVNNESSVAARGSRVIVGFNDADDIEGSGYAVSDSGGAFLHQRLPTLPGGQNLGSPRVAFGLNGEIYYTTLALAGDGVSVVSACVSTDGAATWTCTEASTLAGNSLDTQDQDALAVDSSSSKFRGGVYVAWTDFSQSFGGSFVLFARSANSGLTFGTPQALSAVDGTQLVQDPSLAVGPNGEIYVTYLDGHFGGSGITVTKSLDGGVTFSAPKAAVLFTEVAGTLTGGNGVAARSFPATAVDKNGTLHVAYAAVSPGQSVDRSDIFYVRSTDGGVTFSAPVRLNDDATVTSQWSPSIAVTEDGRVAVKWWDRRNDPVNDGLTDVYMTISADGGSTFARNIRVTDHNWVFGPSALGSFHGDHDGLAGDSGTFHLSWSDERGGDPDVYYAFFPSTAVAAPDFNVSARQLYASVRGGESAVFDLSTSAQNGFSGALSLSVSPPPATLPSWFSFAFSGANVAAGQSAALSVSVSSATPAGTYLLTIAAAGPASTRRTNVRLNVQPAARAASLPVSVSRSPGFTGLAGAPRIDGTGAIHVVYDDDTQNVLGDDVYYRRSTDRGLTWSAPLKVSANAASAAGGVLALDSVGNPYVAFTRQSGSTGEIWVTRSTDRGATFQAPVKVSATGRNADLAAIAVDANRNVVVAYVDRDPSGGSLAMNAVRSTDAGATFGAIQVLANENSINPIQPVSLAFDSKGNAFLVWTTSAVTSGPVSTCRMAIAAGGTTFSARKTVSSTSADAFAPRVAVDRNDAIYVTYYTRNVTATGLNREVLVQKSTDAGSTFSAPVNVSNNGGQSTFPFLVPDARGGVSVVWQDDTGNEQGDVFYARSADGGATFGAAVNLSMNPGVSANPSAAVDALGNLLVAWSDDSAANTEVFSAWAPTGDSAPVAAVVPLPGGSTFDAGAPMSFAANVTQADPNDPVTVTWDFGDGASGAGNPAVHTYVSPGSYVVTVKIKDTLGLVSTATLAVTVRAPSFTGGSEQLLPVVLDTAGAGGTHYTTELTLSSKAAGPVTVLLQYTASAGAGSGYARLTLAPGEQRLVPDAIAFLRANGLTIPDDGSAQIGTLRVLFQGAAPGEVFVGGRTSTPGAGGTFGLFYTGASTSTSTATIFGLQQNAAQRSNLALVNAGPDPVTLRVELQGPNGETLSNPADQTLAGFGWVQLNQPLLGQAVSGRALVTRVAGTSAFSAYGVLNDAVTSDGSFVPPEIPGDATGADRLIPIALTTAGYQTEITLTNFTTQPVALTLTYTGSPQLSAAGTGSAPLVLSPGEQKIIPDSMAFLRSLGLPIPEGSVGGSLLVKAPNGTPASALAAGARTFTNAAGGGTFGLFYPGLTLSGSATSSATVNGLQQNGGQRSNVAVVNRGDAEDSITLRVTYYGTDGAALPNPDTATLAPGEWRQFNQPLSARGANAGFARVERLSGASRFVAYGVLNDQHNSDGSYIPMTR